MFLLITNDSSHNKKIFQEHLVDKKFDFIVLLSIVQYFENLSALDCVIDTLHPLLKGTGQIIIADICDRHTSSVTDALSLFFHCIKNGKSISFFRFIFYLLFSDYRKLRKRASLLNISSAHMIEIAKRNSLYCKKIDGLTLHPSRTSYILTKRLHTEAPDM